MSAQPTHATPPEYRAIVGYRRQQGRYFVEDLGNGIGLEMMLIPGGKFTMGAPEEELDSQDSERPPHPVSVPRFFLGKYPVTQAQWRAVAALEPVERKLGAAPSKFKGDNRPVERVSWFDAVEFCQRLSRYAKRSYRLPSEAEWEYACRAGTTTPFHFGETITTDLANYRGTDNKMFNWSGSYRRGPKGVYRQETTEVGSFKVANAFGLYDMHGNVWEWCADDWHKSYEGAPEDGSAWLDENRTENKGKVLRGGSWHYNPRYCRCAFRNHFNPDDSLDDLGFRVVGAAAARTL